MQLVHPAPENTEVVSDRSPLASARLHRRLTVEEVAKRAGVTADQVEWLEEGRVYRFPSVDSAIETTLLVAAALDIDRREARRLAGLPVPPRPLDVNPTGRLVGVAAISAALMALVAFVLVPALSGKSAPAVDPVVAQAATLPKPWKVQVDVLNGAGDITWTRQVASQIQSLAYTVKKSRPRRPLRLPAECGVLLARRPPDRRAARAPARLRHPPAPRRLQPESPGRDRRTAARPRVDARARRP